MSIFEMDVDVLALQEVEDVGTLRNFVRDYLDNAYRHIVLIEGIHGTCGTAVVLNHAALA
jgi:endonuclease/exonuclease/phosphatase family metal-dependent hydrolase